MNTRYKIRAADIGWYDWLIVFCSSNEIKIHTAISSRRVLSISGLAEEHKDLLSEDVFSISVDECLETDNEI